MIEDICEILRRWWKVQISHTGRHHSIEAHLTASRWHDIEPENRIFEIPLPCCTDIVPLTLDGATPLELSLFFFCRSGPPYVSLHLSDPMRHQ